MTNNEYTWNEKYELTKEYYKINGDLLVPNNYIVNNIRLGAWINTQRKSYKKGALSQERIIKLEEIGVIWEIVNAQWEENYKLANNYYGSHNNLVIPQHYKINNVKLGYWISNQRSRYNKGNLSQERINKLESIGMVWDSVYNQFQTSFPEQAIFYFIKKYFNNTINRYTDLGFELDIYIPDLKLAIEYDGEAFHKNKIDKDIEKNKRCLQHEITLIRIREHKCPDLNSTSTDYKVQGRSVSGLENTINQAINFININYNEKIPLIENINDSISDIYKQYLFYSTYQWDTCYKLAKEYFVKSKDLLIPQFYEIDGIKLGYWLSNQRSLYNKGLLSQERIDRLESIDIVWNVFNSQWENNYILAKDYYNKYGDLKITINYEVDGIKLGYWISRQRVSYTKGILSLDKIDKLNQINMIWSFK